MKISTKVANGMAIAGLVGVLGSVGSFGYSTVVLIEEYLQVAGMHQEMKELSNNYSPCISPLANETNCQRMKERYNSLLQQNNLIKASNGYRQFEEKRDDLFYLLSSLTAGGLVFSFPLYTVGVIASYRRRKEEEFHQELYQDLMGKVEKS